MTTAGYAKPLPRPTRWSREFWEGARRHQLLIQRCRDCHRAVFFPKLFCPHCLGRALAWEPARGQGTIYSFTVVRNNPPSAFVGDLPFVIAIVELDEGVRLLTNVVDCDPDALQCGQRVEVLFDDVTPEVSLPKFRPWAAARG